VTLGASNDRRASVKHPLAEVIAPPNVTCGSVHE
jgi:hypothetical protein